MKQEFAHLISQTGVSEIEIMPCVCDDETKLVKTLVPEGLKHQIVAATPIKKDFIDIFTDVFEKNMTLFFVKNRDLQVADTILYLFRTRENIENYNKKAIYILVRERTGVSSQHITSVINKIKIIDLDLLQLQHRMHDFVGKL